MAQLFPRWTNYVPTLVILGMIFGAARGALLIVVAVGLLSLAPVEADTWWRQSELIPHFLLVADWSKNMILGFFGR